MKVQPQHQKTKRSFVSIFIIAICIMISPFVSSFKPIPSAAKSSPFDRAGAITITGLGNPLLTQGSTFFGTAITTGAFEAVGSYEMPTEVHGSALHCVFMITFPNGTVTIRMNCNMVTFNGVWKVLEGTGAYANLKGNGSLIMPNDDDEILTGTVRGY